MQNTKPWVLDNNILISRLLFPQSTLARVVDHTLVNNRQLFSPKTLAELENVLLREKFDAYATLAERDAFLRYVHNHSIHIAPVSKISLCEDPNDDMFLELAFDGGAQYIVTGDKKLLSLAKYQDIEIITIAELTRRIHL